MGLRQGVLGMVLLALFVNGCAAGEDVAAPMPATPEALAKFYTQQVRWGACAEIAAEALPPIAECAKVTVPVDYSKPDGATAQLALSRIRASGDRIGSLVMNPGGPGVSGLSIVRLGGATALAERFDRIGFDPRGVGSSTPSITCLTAQETDAERAEPPEDNTPAGIEMQEAEIRDYVGKCVERTGADYLAHVGTREVVQDMDVIRAVLGDPALSYLGYSYGTRLGSAYAERYPDRVRALVLDGAIDSSLDPTVESLRQAAGFQKAFDGFGADCARQPDCPLGDDPARTVERFRALVDPLRDKPVHTADPRGLSYNDAITGVQQALYSNSQWGALRAGLAELPQGRGDTLLKLADLYESRGEDGAYTNTQDAFNAIRCVDDPRITDPALAARLDIDYRRAAPFLDDGAGTGAAAREVCAFWPVPNSSQPHRISVAGLPKVVVVSTTEDPATPYQAGVDLAQQLGASLITYRDARHTSALVAGDECLDNAVVAYLTDLTEPSAGLTCGQLG
ncbi:alpha/beta hydrolase [Nocardia sp. NPDC127579]|uniref:alpha/beta hydrolase n=1 Tax=Nocardia sp. NPDC127579 TaxID=3345402 RepID=UPI0036439A69